MYKQFRGILSVSFYNVTNFIQFWRYMYHDSKFAKKEFNHMTNIVFTVI